MKKHTLKILAIACTLCACAFGGTKTTRNPVIGGWYADPQIRIYNGQYWIYATYSDAYDKQVFLDCFSSPDMATWTHHKNIITADEVKWLKRALWAPDSIEKDGKYFLFFACNDATPVDKKNGNTAKRKFGEREYGGIGVAVADKPEGPYKDLIGKPLVDEFYNGAQPIDQYVFKYKNSYYMTYGGWGKCNIVKLADDFKSLDKLPDGSIYKDITPEGYTEGSVMFERRGKWYFMWSEGVWAGNNYKVAYGIADTPFGPFKRLGTVLESERPLATGAGHHSVVNIPNTDDWYICYHRRPVPNRGTHHRVVCIDKMFFDADGKILPVKMTEQGVEPRPLK